MGEISFHGLPEETHHCTSHREGDWIVWRCPHCDLYERRYNWQTGEMRVRRGNADVPHTGMSTSVQNMEALTRLTNLN